MSRGVACLALVVAAGVFAWASAPAPNAQMGGQPLAPPQPLVDMPYKVVKYEGLDDPKATLLDALEQLGKVHRLTFDIDEAAFKAEKVMDVARTEIAATPIPRMERVQLRVVLDKLLQRVPVPSGATWLLRGDHIVITTRQAARREVFRGWAAAAGGDGKEAPAKPFPVLVHANFRPTPLDVALDTIAERSDRNVVLDATVDPKKAATPITLRLRNTPVDTAVLLVAHQAGLQLVEMDNVLLVTTAEKAAAIAKEHAKFRPALPRRETKTP
jgi:hypothetical protein